MSLFQTKGPDPAATAVGLLQGQIGAVNPQFDYQPGQEVSTLEFLRI